MLLQDRRARRDAGHSPNDRVGDGLKEVTISVDDHKLENGMTADESHETRLNTQIEKQ